MSAWKSTLLLPTLFQTAHRSRPIRTAQYLAAPGGQNDSASGRRDRSIPSEGDPAYPKASDLCGHWSLDRRFGEDLHVTVETWFDREGGFETRTYLNCRGDVERLHACGTWDVKRGGFVTMPSPTECRSIGDVTGGCGESGSESLTLEIRDGVRTLFLDLGEELGVSFPRARRSRSPTCSTAGFVTGMLPNPPPIFP
jgi:hypothetical protein